MGASWDPTTYPPGTPCPKCGCGVKQDGALVGSKWALHCVVYLHVEYFCTDLRVVGSFLPHWKWQTQHEFECTRWDNWRCV